MILWAAGCYRVHLIECRITCSHGICPRDLTCLDDGFCHGEGHTEACGGDGGIGGTCSEDSVRLAAGLKHTCVAAEDGAVWCWGLNDVGQYGDGTVEAHRDPTRTTGWPMPLDLAAGGSQTCVVAEGGLVRCAGQDSSGELGDGAVDSSGTGMIVDAIGVTADEVAAGANFTCARASGQVYCWGANNAGQLGDGMVVPHAMPAAVSGIADAVGIDAGNRHACAVRATGAVSCWGFGYLGNGALAPGGSSIPVQAAASGYTAVATGLDATCALAQGTGAVVCWGSNEDGQVGNGTTTPILVPTANGLTDAVQLALGPHHSCARMADGTIWCWGENRFGQLGDGTVRDIVSTPVQVLDVDDAIDLEVGSDFSCAILSDQTVRCWGNNDAGQLGDGTTRQRSAPVPAPLDCTSI